MSNNTLILFKPFQVKRWIISNVLIFTKLQFVRHVSVHPPCWSFYRYTVSLYRESCAISQASSRNRPKYSQQADLVVFILNPMYSHSCSHLTDYSDSVVFPRRNPRLCGLQSTHRGPLYSQSAGPSLAQQMPEMQRLPGATCGEVLQQGRQRLLQRWFLQVSSPPFGYLHQLNYLN